MSRGDGLARLRGALEEHGSRVRGSNARLRARCPVHESRGLTLAVSQGRCGALVKCHAQCETADVLAALGLSWADLYDEPRDRPPRPWKAPRRPPTPAEQAGKAIVRAVTIMLTAEAQKAAAFLLPKLSPAERVDLAEWGCRRDADTHYWRTLARYAALACDEAYLRRAYADVAAWKADPGADKPAHEQFVVLMTRKEDLERSREPVPG